MAEPEDVKRLLCKHLSKASYNKNVADLIADTWQTQAVILQTWPALHEGEGFSAFTAMLPLGPVSALVVLFRGTKGTPEWLSYPEALATGELLRSMEGLTGFTPFVDTLEQVWNQPGDGVNGCPPFTMKDAISRALMEGKLVWMAGHSRGGAIAQLAAALLMCGQESRYPGTNLCQLSIMTFNSPMCLLAGDVIRYEEAREEKGVEHRRVEHRGDLVRLLPPGMGLQHGGDPETHGEGLMQNERIVGTALSAVRAFAERGSNSDTGGAFRSLASAFVKHATESHR